MTPAGSGDPQAIAAKEWICPTCGAHAITSESIRRMGCRGPFPGQAHDSNEMTEAPRG